MTRDNIVPSRRERLWRAVKWLDAGDLKGHAAVEEACRRFDLSPGDEEFLQALWRERAAQRSPDTAA